ncbi:MAG: diacylglycerol/polyprenol kinase family protein [Acholeplasmataceae bacterium]
MNDLYALLLSYALVFSVIGVATLLQRTKVLGDEGARKFIHIGVSNWWILAMLTFDDVLLALIPPFTFILLNYYSYRTNLIKSMERGGKGNLGTVYFPVALFVLVAITFGFGEPMIGAIGILILGYGDGFAAIFGKAYGKREIANGKTVTGTIAMFISSLVVALILFVIAWPSHAHLALAVAGVATLIELHTPKGFDNLSVPLGTSLFTYLLLLLFSLV